MSQYTFNPINPSSTTGDELATALDNYLISRDSMNSGTSRPSYVSAGMLWLDTTADPWLVKFYDGADDLVLYDIDATAHTATAPITAGGTGANSPSGARTVLGLGALAVLNVVGSAQISAGAVGTAQIAANAVTRAEMATDVANAGKYLGYDGGGNVVAGTPGTPTSQLVAALANVGSNGSTARCAVIGGLPYLMQDGSIRIFGLGTAALSNGDSQTANLMFPRAAQFDAAALPLTGAIVSISSSTGCHYALSSDGKVYAMGANASGQLGQGDTVARYKFTLINYFPTNSLVVSKVFVPSNSDNGSNALTVLFLCTNGQLYACGRGTEGALGNGTTTAAQSTPVRVGTLTNIIGASISGNEDAHCVAFDNAGNGWTWGLNATGQLGDGTLTQRNSPVTITAVSNIVEAHAIGGISGTWTAATYLRNTSGVIYATGYNGQGNLGVGDTTNRQAFTVAVGTLPAAVEIFVASNGLPSAGFRTSSGAVYTTGRNGHGELGQGNTTPLNVFTQIAGLTGCTKALFGGSANGSDNFVDLVALVGGVLKTCGQGAEGSLGQGALADVLTLTTVPLPHPFQNDTVADFAIYGGLAGKMLNVLFASGKTLSCGYTNAAGTAMGVANNIGSIVTTAQLEPLIMPYP